MRVNRNLAKPLLSTVFLLLLTTVILSGSYTSFTAKGLYLDDYLTAFTGVTNGDISKTSGGDPKPARSNEGVITLPATLQVGESPYHTPDAAVAFSTHQARAPPLT